MSTLPSLLIACSALIILALGTLHLWYTFCGPMLLPRDRELHARMQEVSPVITRGTTMWRAWVGFNATHSFGAMLFGAVYGYLALLHADFLFQSTYLLLLGLLLLSGFGVIARLYFFRVPFVGILLAALLYAIALVIVWA